MSFHIVPISDGITFTGENMRLQYDIFTMSTLVGMVEQDMGVDMEDTLADEWTTHRQYKADITDANVVARLAMRHPHHHHWDRARR